MALTVFPHMLTRFTRRVGVGHAALPALALLALGFAFVCPSVAAEQREQGRCIWVLGDSTVEDVPSKLAELLPGRQIIAGGIGAQTSIQIAARAGALPTHLTVDGDAIPATGSVEARGVNPRLISGSPPSGKIRGSLAGRSGELTRDDKDAYLFTPDPAATSTPVAANIAFTPDTREAHGCILILGAGRNNYNATERVLFDIGAILGSYTESKNKEPARFLVLSVPNAAGEGIGTPPYKIIMRLNQALAQRYGRNFLDFHQYAVEKGVKVLGLATDSATEGWIAQDIVPEVLRRDIIHLNAQGNDVFAAFIAAAIKERGW